MQVIEILMIGYCNSGYNKQTLPVNNLSKSVVKMQDNWLITQLINRTVSGSRLPQVSVMIELEQCDGDGTQNTTCQDTFNTHVFETSSVDSAARNHCQVHRVSPDDTSGARMNETVHFAIQDETSCIVVTRVLVFFRVCPQQTFDLIYHPETTAPVARNQFSNTQPGDSCANGSVMCGECSN